MTDTTTRSAGAYQTSWTVCPLTRESCTTRCSWAFMDETADGIREPACKMLDCINDIAESLDSLTYRL